MTTAERIPKNRLEAFSDGVIAISVTLLVLELKIPVLAQGDSPAQAWEGLSAMKGTVAACSFSFLTVAIFWVNHHQLVHSLRHTSRKLLWTNMLALFWLSIIPFPTAFLGRYPANPVAISLYGAILAATALAFVALRRVAAPLMHDHAPVNWARSATGPLLYTLGAIAGWVAPWIAYAAFIAVPLVYFVPMVHVDDGDAVPMEPDPQKEQT